MTTMSTSCACYLLLLVCWDYCCISDVKPHCVTVVVAQEALKVPTDRKHYKILQKGVGGRGERKTRTVSTLHSRLVRKRELKSSGAESSVRARDQDFSEARDRASISARGI